MARPNFIVEFRPGAGPFYSGLNGRLVLPGTAGAKASTPDDASFAVTDLDARVDLRVDRWIPHYMTGSNAIFLAGQWGAAGQRSWRFYLHSVGYLGFQWSNDGTTISAEVLSTVNPYVAFGGRLAVRVTFDVNNGTGGKTATFYTAPTKAGPWTQIGATVTSAGTTSLFNSTAALEVGDSANAGQRPVVGDMYGFELLASIGGASVANPDFTNHSAGASSFNDAQGRTWTVAAPAALTEGVIDFPWVSLSAGGPHGNRVRHAAWQIGRERDSDEWPPGEATIELYNYDRLFDPDNTSGTYTGKLLPGVPFRIRTDGTFGTHDHFYGFVEDGWEQTHQHPADGYCTVKLVDLFGVLPGFTLPGVLEHAIVSPKPVGYWPLTESSGTETVADRGSGHNQGTVSGDGITFGDPALFPGDGTSVAFDGSSDFIQVSTGPLLADTWNGALVALLSTTLPAEVNTQHPIWMQSDGAALAVVKTWNLIVDGDGKLRLTSFKNSAGIVRQSLATVTDSKPHVVFAQTVLDITVAVTPESGVGIDTADLTQVDAFQPGFDPGGNGTAIAGTPRAKTGYTLNYFPGRLSHIAIYDRGLGRADRDNILTAAQALSGKRSDEQIRWALNRIGVPDSLLNLDVGRAIMGPATTAGRDALDFCREVQRTEQGALYVDHTDGGKIRFRERYADWLATRSTSVQVTFSDDPAAGFVVRVEPGTLVVEANGRRTIVNRWTVTWVDGEVTEEDEPSRLAYGASGDNIDTQASTPELARGIAQFKLALTKDPQTRIRGLGFTPSADQSGFTTAVGAQIADRVRYRSQPSSTGSVIDKQMQLAGIRHEVEDMDWKVQVFTTTAPAAHQQLFTLGTSELDSTDVLGV